MINKKKNELQLDNYSEIDSIISFLSSNKLSIVKLNHTLDTSIQTFTQYHGYFQLSKDASNLSIFNKKPLIKPNHIREMDQDA